MESRKRLNLALLLLILVLAAVAYLQPGREGPAPSARLTGLQPAQVTRILIERPGKEDMRLLRKQGWRLEVPVKAAADPSRVAILLDLVQARVQAHFPAAGRDLAPYQLDRPLARITFNETLIRFGGPAPLGRRRYLLLDGQVVLVNDQAFYLLQAGPSAFIATRPADASEAQGAVSKR